MELIVDIQCFVNGKNELIVKELAVASVQDKEDKEYSILFKPPYPWYNLSAKCRSTNSWLTRNYHGISWDSGEIDYTQLNTIINNLIKEATCIYVKGLQKKIWFEDYIKQLEDKRIVNIEDLGCPPLRELRTDVYRHHQACHRYTNQVNINCALQNVIEIKKWYNSFYKK